jgi:hypothetical protein
MDSLFFDPLIAFDNSEKSKLLVADVGSTIV